MATLAFAGGGTGRLSIDYGFDYDLIATVAAHGALELTPIILSASGGLLIAGAMRLLLPGGAPVCWFREHANYSLSL